jgi:hypothetical protein
LFLGNSGSRFLFWDGANYSMPGGSLFTTGLNTQGGNLNCGNFLSSGEVRTNGGNMVADVGSVFASNFILNDDNLSRDTGVYFGGAAGHINFNTNGVTRCQMRPSNTQFWGDVFATGDFIHNSDRRLKDDIQTIADPLGLIRALRGVTWTWKRDGKPGLGVIAQELETVLPHLVTDDADGNKSVALMPLIGALIEAIKCLEARVEELESEVI